MYRGAGPGRFERKVFADDGLREELMPAFAALLRAKGHKFLIEIDNWITAQESSLAETHKGKEDESRPASACITSSRKSSRYGSMVTVADSRNALM